MTLKMTHQAVIKVGVKMSTKMQISEFLVEGSGILFMWREGWRDAFERENTWGQKNWSRSWRKEKRWESNVELGSLDNSTLHWYSDANISLHVAKKNADTVTYTQQPHTEKSPWGCWLLIIFREKKPMHFKWKSPLENQRLVVFNMSSEKAPLSIYEPTWFSFLCVKAAHVNI